MTLSSANRALLRDFQVGRATPKMWLFEHDPQDTTVGGELGAIYLAARDSGSGTDPFESSNAGTAGFCMIVADPPWALVKPGESVTITAYHYMYDHNTAVGSPLLQQWSVNSGSAILSVAYGGTCVVTPTGGENSEVVVRITVARGPFTVNGTQWTWTQHRDIPIGVSSTGYETVSGTVTITEAFGQEASAELELAGDTSGVSLLAGRMVGLHLDTYYDSAKTNLSSDGRARPQNLFYGRVPNFTSLRDARDARITRIQLTSAAEPLNAHRMWTESDSQTQDWDVVGQEQPIYAVGSPASGTDPTSLVSYIENVIGTDPDLTYNRFSFYMASFGNLSQDFNVKVWDDGQEFYDARQPVDGIWNMVKGPCTAVLGMPYCDAEGNLNLLPHPAVRGDEYWSTANAIFTSADPLNRSYTVGEVRVDAFPGYPSHGVRWDGLVLSGWDDGLNLIEVTSGNVGSQYVVNRDYTGYALRGDAVESDWADALLALVNRSWDVTVTVPCWGRVLFLGAFAYVDFPSGVTGVPDATGMAYVDWIQHRIDMRTHMMWTTARFVQLTGGLA